MLEPGDAEESLAGIDKDLKDDDLSTTEETTSLSGASASEIEEDQKWEALKQYSKRFGVDVSGIKEKKLFSNRIDFGLTGASPAVEATKTEEEVLQDLARDLKADQVISTVEACSWTSQPAASESSPGTQDKDALQLTFGYAGDLDENPPFAKFDIRDDKCMQVGGFKHGQIVRDRNGSELVVVGVRSADGTPRLWFHPKSLGRPGAGAFRGGTLSALRTRVQLVPDRHEKLREMSPEEFEDGDCSDDEEVIKCKYCHLPIGCQSYLDKKQKGAPVHGECMGLLLQEGISQEQQRRKEQDDEEKKKIRQDYDIGWHVDNVPSNVIPATRLGVTPAPQGMCCLVFNQTTHSIAVAPTLEPAESVNLEYLSTALKVRLQEGREPLFSLDPVDGAEVEKDAMQEKCYEPEWLAGTNVGEVLFQADYHLKELSFGECEQPVVGMKCCSEFNEEHKRLNDEEWCAREWFIVKKADVKLTDANVLIPYVKMGVEAREQVSVNGVYEDKPVTCKTHPMVQYAEQFTRYFDLIAERKSAMYHLRDLAKASVLAKMLIENDVNMHGPWLHLAEEERPISSMEVPQLWNRREQNHIEVRANVVVQAKEKNKAWGLYGGVNFGLQAQQIAMPSQIAAARRRQMNRISTTGLRGQALPQGISMSPSGELPAAGISAVSRPGVTAALTGTRATSRLGLSATAMVPKQHLSVLAAAPGTSMAAAAAPMQIGGISGAPQISITAVVSPGITVLNTTPASFQLGGMLAMQSARIGIQVPSRPMPGIPGPYGELLRKIDPRGVDLNLDEFNFSHLNRAEGHDWEDANNVKSAPMGGAFWAALDDDSTSMFEDKDKALLKAVYDPNLCDRREEGERFVPPDTNLAYVQKLRGLIVLEAGARERRKEHFCSPKFSTANPGPLFPFSFQATVELDHGKASNSKLHPRPDYISQAHKFDEVLKSTTPKFDKASEEGTRYRVYNVGQLEVRTIQSRGAEEIICAVYSKTAPVRRREIEVRAVGDDEKLCKVTEYVEKFQNTRRSYTVLETAAGDIIVTEKWRDGRILWEENPADFEDRKCLGKIIRSAACRKDEVSVGMIKNYQTKHQWQCDRLGPGSSRSADCKRYAQGVYCEAAGEGRGVQSGFAKPHPGTAKWRLSENWCAPCSSTPGATSVFADGKRPSTGATVQVKETGRVGEIVFDDNTAMPYKVRFDDGDSPSSKWYKESDVQLPSTQSR